MHMDQFFLDLPIYFKFKLNKLNAQDCYARVELQLLNFQRYHSQT